MTPTNDKDPIEALEFEKYPWLAQNIEKLANTPCEFSVAFWSDFLQSLNDALRQAARSQADTIAVKREDVPDGLKEAIKNCRHGYRKDIGISSVWTDLYETVIKAASLLAEDQNHDL